MSQQNAGALVSAVLLAGGVFGGKQPGLTSVESPKTSRMPVPGGDGADGLGDAPRQWGKDLGDP